MPLSMAVRRLVALPLLLLPLLLLGAADAASDAGPSSPRGPWELPAPGSCAPSRGLRGWPIGEDAPPLPFRSGDTIRMEKLPVLRSYLPTAIWEERDRFFFDGMQLEIGPCFRDYAPPAFFRDATEKLRGRARLLPGGGLADYEAGLPFPPDTIAKDDPQAGLEWAWNVTERYQAGGLRARFRVSDMVGRSGRAEPYEGEIFLVRLSHRAERAAHRYQARRSHGRLWVAGGKMTAPFAAREYAWRQYRDLEAERDAARSDELYAYLPTWRRVRRVNSASLEGLFMPSFSVGVQPATQLAVGGSPSQGGGAVGAAGPTGATSTILPKRTGFEGLVLRPALYSWRVLGLQDVLAPINATSAAYPDEPDRSFGPWGLSFASDRWDLRRALVLEARAKESRGSDQVSRLILYVDLQTLTPLYSISYDAKDEERDVGQYVGRWSEDREDYPRWPDDPTRPVRVIDSVGESFANLSEGGGWRRESWAAVATPPEEKELRRLLSSADLTRGR